ncbi:arsenate reductase ArsC [bacterium]|nr:arsenate reductase ArsC [bacterium]
MKKKVLFVCLHNSARSQMAEGILRHLYGEKYEAYSAGSTPTRLHPLAKEAMAEAGIDISRQEAKGLETLASITFDLAVTVCGSDATCPFIPNTKATMHKEFDDPSSSNDMKMFRRVRDEIAAWVRDTFRDPAGLQPPGELPAIVIREE